MYQLWANASIKCCGSGLNTVYILDSNTFGANGGISATKLGNAFETFRANGSISITEIVFFCSYTKMQFWANTNIKCLWTLFSF